jgi:hypothetical protein
MAMDSTMTDQMDRLEVNGLGFQPPAGMVDLTTYAFRSADGRQSLEIEMIPGADASLERMKDAASMFADEVRRALDLEPEVQPFGPLENGSQGWLVAYETEVRGMCDPQSKPRELCAFGLLSDGRGVQLSERTLTGTEEQFFRILASIRPLGSTEQTPAQGLVRRSVGTIQLDVPENLEPPGVLLFSMAPEATGSRETEHGELSLAVIVKPNSGAGTRALPALAPLTRQRSSGDEDVRTESVETSSGMSIELFGRATGSMKEKLGPQFERMVEMLKK